jgi:lysophospholipase L1-like esterase
MTRLLFASLFTLSLTLLAGACGSDATMMMMVTPPDTSPHMYEADDPNIQYTGRIDYTNAKQPKFALGATYVTARFKGTGVSVLLKDEHRYGKWRNYYDPVIDGTVYPKIRPDDDITIIKNEVTTTLPYGEHEITVVKRTEANVGMGYFVGFEFAGTILPPPDRPAHKMLIFGDSITAGSGIEVPDGDPGCTADDWGQPVQNADLAYGPVAARMLDADVHVVGVSGIGLVRDYNSDPAQGDIRTMPQVYNLVLPELPSGATWTAASYQPDAIVVALGTNDFSPGPLNADNTPADGRTMMDSGTYATAYISFVDMLRADYPAAHIFLMASPMLVNGWPTAAYNSKAGLENALAMVEDHYVTAGDTKLHTVLGISKQAGGCGTHPNVAGHMVTATELATAVKAATGW